MSSWDNERTRVFHAYWGEKASDRRIIQRTHNRVRDARARCTRYWNSTRMQDDLRKEAHKVPARFNPGFSGHG